MTEPIPFDLYTLRAARLFDIPPSRVTTRQRQLAKAHSMAFVYASPSLQNLMERWRENGFRDWVRSEYE